MDAVSMAPAGLESDALEGGGVRHALFTRAGGVSTGLFASLNCGLASGDEHAHIAENRARVAALVTGYQVHGCEAVPVEAPWRVEDRPRADALVTRTPGVVLGVLTADCAPVLFADSGAGVVGVAHAGWRGARDGVLEAAVEAAEVEGFTLVGRLGEIAQAQ